MRSYILWFTQRVGSTLLTQALEDTGVVGRPREWLSSDVPSDPAALRARLWAEPIIAVKYGMTPQLHAELTTTFRAATGAGDERAAWDAMFPNCRHLFMTRRNRVRLAVSWWRAIQSTEWHRPTRDGTVATASEPRAVDDAYDGNAIDHLVREASVREAAIQDVFDRWNLAPYTIVYEDFIARYADTVRDVLAFLGAPAVAIPAPSYARLADDLSERWYRRYCDEHPI
jgi:trehalose 2-sulfotransferase